MKQSIYLTLFICSIIKIHAQSTDTIVTIFPNPFSSTATIQFSATQNDTITINIYSVIGTTMQTYFNNTVLPTGNYSITLQGDTLPEGVYFVRIKKGTNTIIYKKVIKENSTSSVIENTKENTFAIYPNPATNELNIQCNDCVKGSNLNNIVMYDILGNQVLNQTLKNQTTTLNIEHLTKGIYIIKISDGINIKQQKIIIK